MTDQVYVVAVSVILSILGVIGIGHLFRSYRLDSFREQIFALREEVFLYSLDQGLLENPAYRDLRALLNGTLRYAHKVTFPHMAMLMFAQRFFKLTLKEENSPMKRWAIAVDALCPEQKTEFLRFNKAALELFVKKIAFSSVLFWGFVLWIAFRLAIRGGLTATRLQKADFGKVFNFVQKYLPMNLLEAEALRAN